jgi:CBS domain-containing protein
MKVSKMMHKGVKWVSPDTTVKALASKMRRFDVGAIPIGENDRLIGMVTDRDIVVRAIANGKDISKLKARNIMTKGVVWCRDIDDARRAARLMETKHIRRLPVIDANKRMVGMLSLGDIAHFAPQKLTGEVARAVSGHHR